MRPIVIRTLRREFRIERQAAASPLWYVEACPSIDGGPLAGAVVDIEGSQTFFKARLISGRVLEGTLRHIAAQFDLFVLSCATADESDAISLPAALLTSPEGKRVLFIGGRKSGKTTLAVRLLAAGWLFEGDERVFVRTDGIAAHPRTLRIAHSLARRNPALADLLDGAPALDPLGKDMTYALDPRRWGRDWRIHAGKIDTLFFLESVGTAHSAIRRIGSDEAYGRALQLFNSVEVVTARRLSLLRSVLATPYAFHLELGAPDGAADCVTKAVAAIRPATPIDAF